MKDCTFKKNITMHIKRRESKKDNIIINSEMSSSNKSEIKKENYFKDENIDDFLHKYYRIHTKEFSLIDLYNNISQFLFTIRIYIIIIFICVILIIMYS